METQIESLWVFAILSKFTTFSNYNLFGAILIMGLAWFIMGIIFWVHPGGPAWGNYYKWKKPGFAKPIPGPIGYPIIGSMNLMTNLAHHKIAAMAKLFHWTRLMAFSLGNTRVIVTCNPDVAKEILNSSVFADRPVKESAYSLMFNRAIGFAPYGVYWRTLRKIAATHLFCPKQIKSAENQRLDIAEQMVNILKTRAAKTVTVRAVLKSASLNNMMCSVFGRKYKLDTFNGEMDELRNMVDEGYELLGELNWSDHLSWLSEFDPQKIRFRCSNLVPKVNRFVSRIISDHRVERNKTNRDFVDVLLSLDDSNKLSESDMIAVLWEMIFRGTDTVAVLIEWVLARMTLHPGIQSTVQNELDKIIGTSRAVEESNLSSLPYLTAVIKETLRLHPPGPLLSWARLSITDTTIDGYHVPRGTTAMVNMWAISRDPEIWADPLEFKPDRFITKEGENEFSVLGSDLRLAPFGSGRRTCPGKNLGLATVCFWVATLLHEFEWLPSDQSGQVDLTEVLKLSSEMKIPLSAKLRPRRRSCEAF